MTEPNVTVTPDAEGHPTFRVRLRGGVEPPALTGCREGILQAGVITPPEQGRANKELLELLTARLGLRAGVLTVVAGAGERDKVVGSRVVTTPDLVRRLQEALRP